MAGSLWHRLSANWEYLGARTPAVGMDEATVLMPHWEKLKQCEVQALLRLRFATCCSPVAIEVHVDGSGAGKAPWAIIVLWQDSRGEWFYGGHRVANVVMDENHPEYIGATAEGSNYAELSGFVWGFTLYLAVQDRKSDSMF